MLGHVGGPSDSCRIEENLRTSHCSEARRFGKPLIPANEHAHIGRAGMMSGEVEVTGSEIEFLIIAGVIRNMHFPIMTGYPTVDVNHYRGIMINAGRAALT